MKRTSRADATSLNSSFSALTCLQVPQVFAAHLVVPAFAVSITATPNVKPGANCSGTVASPGSGSTGIRVVTLGTLALQLRLDIIMLLWAQVLPAHSICDRKMFFSSG